MPCSASSTPAPAAGNLPIKFNGTLFTVDEVFDPDYRRWGGPYWLQNTRLPYWSMLYSGDYEMMLPLFRMCMDQLPLRKAATKTYFGHDGAYYPETFHFWGNYADRQLRIQPRRSASRHHGEPLYPAALGGDH
jgi:hypothetical protein